jgi:hypothetical protein
MNTLTASPVPLLRDGDRMDREEFERRWDAMPDLKKAELIEGVVYMPAAALSMSHGAPHFDLITWLGKYRLRTPGVTGADNASIRFDKRNMPQPDILLRIDEAFGGHSRITPDKILDGPPELVAEISRTTRSIDLGVKKSVYQRQGVREYIVWSVEEKTFDWFILRNGKYTPLEPDADGILKSEVFPGLWIDAAALLVGDTSKAFEAAQLGTGSPDHTAFIALLKSRSAPSAPQ